MFLYGTSFGDNPTFAPNFADTMAHEHDQRAAADALWQTTKDLADYRDNSNGEQAAKGEAYERRNKAIFDATGVQLDNPMKFDIFKLKPEPGAAGLPEPSARDDIAAQEQAWRDKAAALAREKPEFANVIGIDRPVIEDAYAITRGAEQASAAADAQASAAGLSRTQRLGASLGGGLAGALRDPLQVATLAAGGGVSSPARALGWRLLESVFTEAAVNGGIEAGVQLSSRDWKQRAGVDASLSTSLKQVGLAALFGGGFGGLLEGGREVGRLLGREVPDEVLTRAAGGNPEPGDFTTIADALGVTPDPATVRAADLAAEQPVLDAAAFGPPPEGLGDDEAAAMAAQALRAADSPDDVRGAAIDRIVSQQSPVGAAPLRPVSLMQFLSSRSVGGLKDESGELAAMGLSRKFVPGGGALVRKNGKRLDDAREAAAEAGYFDDLYGDPETAVAKSTPDDLLRLLRQEAGGEPVYSARNDGGRQFAWLDYERQRTAQTAYRRLVEEVDSAASSLGIEHRLDDSVLVRAAELVDHETSPVDALERALDEDYRNYSDALAERGEEAPDVQDIPFFEDAGTGPAAGRAVGSARADGAAGGPGGIEAPGGGLSRAGGDEGESGLRAPGATPEPATPEAGEIAALALTEAQSPPSFLTKLSADNRAAFNASSDVNRDVAIRLGRKIDMLVETGSERAHQLYGKLGDILEAMNLAPEPIFTGTGTRRAASMIKDASGQSIEIGGGAVPERGLVVANQYADGKIYIGKPGEGHFAISDRYPHDLRGDPVKIGFLTPDGEFLDRAEALAWVDANEKKIRPSENMGRELDASDYREQVPNSNKMAARPSAETTAAGEQQLIEGVKPVSTKEKLDAKGNKPLRGGDAAPPEGGLFDLESRKQLSIWDAMPAAKSADGDILHATHETMIADADRTEFFGDLIAACKD